MSNARSQKSGVRGQNAANGRGIQTRGWWIDARQEKPDDDLDVLCCNATNEMMWVGYHSAGDWIKPDSAGDIVMTHLVSHWMDLPETPQ